MKKYSKLTNEKMLTSSDSSFTYPSSFTLGIIIANQREQKFKQGFQISTKPYIANGVFGLARTQSRNLLTLGQNV